MKDERINIRLDSKLAQQIKSYAKRQHTTVTALIERHLRDLLEQERLKSVHDAEQI